MPHSCPQHSTPPKKVQCSAIHCNGLRPEKRRAGAGCFCKKTIVHPSVCWTVDCSWRAMFQWSTLTTPLYTVLVLVTSASYWWLPVVLFGVRIISTVSWRPMPLTSSGCDSTASNSHLEEIATSNQFGIDTSKEGWRVLCKEQILWWRRSIVWSNKGCFSWQNINKDIFQWWLSHFIRKVPIHLFWNSELTFTRLPLES